MPKYLIVTFVIIFFCLELNAQTYSKNIKPIIEPSHKDECGCNYYLKEGNKETIIFHSENTSTDNIAWMNLGGVDVKLKRIEVIRPTQKLVVGDTIVTRYSSVKYDVTVIEILTSVCSPSNDNCEYERSKVTIIAICQDKKEIAKAFGGCGCG